MDKEQSEFYNTCDLYFNTLAEADITAFSEYFDFVKYNIKPKSKILEAGCGTGQSVDWLTGLGYDVTGVDGTERFINHAKAKFPLAKFVKADLAELPFSANSFDAVTSFNVLEHVKDVPAVLVESLRIIKPGGLLLVHSPNLLSAKHMLDAYRFKQGMTFEGRKNNFELLVLAIKDIFSLLNRRLTNRFKFVYREPNKTFEFSDNDATVYLNPVDISLALKKMGADIVSYQSVRHLANNSILKIIGSYFLGDHMSIVRIVARKK